MPELGAQPDRSPAARLLTPRSVLVAGVSQRPDTLGQRVLGNLVASGYSGDIHVLGRTPATLFGLECATSFDELPRGIDLVLLTAPAAGTIDLVRGCVSHGVGAAVCYASGFAEQGEEGRRQEAELGRIAGEGGMGLVGPNCFGFLNTVDDLPTLLTSISAVPVPDADLGRGVAVIAQSGSIGAYVASSLGSRGVPISYLVTTGNEIGLGTPELIEFFSDSEHTGAIAVYAEQVRDPERFTAAVRKAYERGKPIVFMHPGRGERGRAAVASHTGALTGDHAVMTTMVRRAGVAVVDTLEELIDLSQLLLRYPRPPSKGASVITVSGALCAIATDTAEAFGLDLPSPTVTDNELAKALPFTEVRNPIDLSTQTLTQPALLRMAAQQMAEDPNIGSVLVSLPPVGELLDSAWLDQVLAGMGPSGKPLVYVVQNEEEPPPAFLQKVLERRIVFHRSPERAMRMLARVTGYGRARAVGRGTVLHESVSGLPLLTRGVQPEWRGKQVLSALGIPVPDGELAHSTDEAVAIAMRVGYPVVAKAQAGRLAHKSDVGAVLLGIEDEDELRGGWQHLQDTVAKEVPGLALDGILVERMCPSGVELVVGARRDPQWGVILVVGSGGVLVELLDDVRLLPADLPKSAIVEEIDRLRVAKLLRGFRGSTPADVTAIADVAGKLGRLMLSEPTIREVDINPLVAYSTGVVALDALVVVEPDASTSSE